MMKSILILFLGLCVSMNALAQGVILFRNNANSTVMDGRTGLPVAEAVATAGLYFTPDLGAEPNPNQPTDGFLLASVIPITAGGFYDGGIVTLPGLATGSQVLLQVRGWSAGYASYAEAWNDPDSQPLLGFSNLMGPVTLGSQSIDLATLVQGFTLAPIPEPSSLALGILGMLGMALALARPSRRGT